MPAVYSVVHAGRRDERIEGKRRQVPARRVDLQPVAEQRHQVATGSLPVEKQEWDAPTRELGDHVEHQIRLTCARAPVDAQSLEEFGLADSGRPMLLPVD